MQIFEIKTTQKIEALDITYKVEKIIKENKINQGIILIFVPHTTAGIIINENADESVIKDIKNTLEKLIPLHGSYQHLEGNSAAHIKAGILGSEISLIIEDGRLALGTWQGIYFMEFDGPRNRKVWVKILGN